MAHPDRAQPAHRVFCNRTLNLRAVGAVGYDMDYTLVHYDSRAWEDRAYAHLRASLQARGWPVADLGFDPALVIRGLVIDRELGNIVKANRFGYVKLAAHGTRMLDFDAQRRLYSRVVVELEDDRWVFLNTLFSLSESVMYAQLVDRLDEGRVPGVLGYADLYDEVKDALDAAHLEGKLKSDIVADPDRFVVLDARAPLALLDQRAAGKRLLLVTNSDWAYSRFMMSYAFDRFLPGSTSWRDLFDLVIVSAAKPGFFESSTPIYEIVTDDGLLRPLPAGLTGDGAYAAGSARAIEQYLGLEGADILYVGDHVYADVHMSKEVRRWRTALVVPELEAELAALEAFAGSQEALADLMAAKERLESLAARERLAQLRRRSGHSPAPEAADDDLPAASALRAQIGQLDERIAPLAQASSELANPRWGLLMRTGNDKSLLARQVENYADLYCARVSDFVAATPFAYFRSPRGSLPHDPGPYAGAVPGDPDGGPG